MPSNVSLSSHTENTGGSSGSVTSASVRTGKGATAGGMSVLLMKLKRLPGKTGLM